VLNKTLKIKNRVILLIDKTLPLLQDCCQVKSISRLLLLTNIYLNLSN